jgi:hypothetical protein
MIIHKCDICKKICEDNKFTTIQVPINKYTYLMENGVKIDKIKSPTEHSYLEICYSCASLIADFLDSLGVSS